MKKETFIQKLIRLLKTIIFKESEEKEKENSDLLKREMCIKAVRSGVCPNSCCICAWNVEKE